MSKSLYFLLVVGLIFVGAGIAWLIQVSGRANGAAEITGTVVDPSSKIQSKKKIIVAVIEYKDERGKTRYFVSQYKKHLISKYRNQGSGYQVGESVRVLLNESKDWVEIKTWKIWSGPFSISGVGIALVALVALVWNRQRKMSIANN